MIPNMVSEGLDIIGTAICIFIWMLVVGACVAGIWSMVTA